MRHLFPLSTDSLNSIKPYVTCSVEPNNSNKSVNFFVSIEYLTGEHGTKIVTAGSQDNPVSRKICVLHPQSDIAECVALAKRVHGIEDGLGMGIGHDVFGSHAALRISQGSQTTPGIWNRHTSHPPLHHLHVQHLNHALSCGRVSICACMWDSNRRLRQK